MGGCGPWLFMNLYYMAAVNLDYWLLVGVKIERWLFGDFAMYYSCMLKSIEDNGCS